MTGRLHGGWGGFLFMPNSADGLLEESEAENYGEPYATTAAEPRA